MLKSALSDAGYQVFQATDGLEALNLIQDNHFDMLVTDLNMPEMDGISLIQAVRRISGNRFLPIIMLTTESQDDIREKGKSAGASGWINKPLKMEQFLGVLRLVMP